MKNVIIGLLLLNNNVEAMTSKGLRSDILSADTKLDASYNIEITH